MRTRRTKRMLRWMTRDLWQTRNSFGKVLFLWMWVFVPFVCLFEFVDENTTKEERGDD